jgi:hypothetical protein
VSKHIEGIDSYIEATPRDKSGLDAIKFIIETHIGQGERLKQCCQKYGMDQYVPEDFHKGYKQGLITVLRIISRLKECD